MKLIKNKAYMSSSTKKLYFYDGNHMFNRYGEVEKEIPDDLLRSTKDDKIAKYAILLGQNNFARDSDTFVAPKEKSILRIYNQNGDYFYGIIRNGRIIEQDGSNTGLLYTAYEKIRPTKEQREALEAVSKLDEQKEKLENKIKKYQNEMRELQHKNQGLSSKVSNAFGRISRKEFVEIFENNLPEGLKEEMKRNDYRIEQHNSMVFNSITIEREYFIEKWHDSVMVYREYDDTAHLDTSSPEAEKLARKYINRYSKPLPVKAKVDSRLGLGDKRWLILYETYYLPVNENTKEEAEKLAKEFAKR